MAIQVTCPGCHKRFQVSDKFAGKEGPCPKCKAKIKIPEAGDEGVVHEPEPAGPTDAAGRPVLKPIEREETRVTVVGVIAIVTAVLAVLVAAVALRSMDPIPGWLLGIGAVLIGPPIALAGYSFLRNDDFEPHRGLPLMLRIGVCGLGYAALWGVFALVRTFVFGGDPLEAFHLLFVIPPAVALGGLLALATLDLDYGSGAIHFGMYLLVTIALALIMKVPLM